jgi:hypothetical protein
MQKRLAFLCLLALVFHAGGHFCFAQSAADYAVRVSAVVSTNPVQITLSWPRDPQATNYIIYRKSRDSLSWGSSIATLAGNATTYADNNVSVGSAYDYRVSKRAAGYIGEGYIYAGINVPLVTSRGKIILFVENSLTSALSMEISRLQQDLVGDGWTVLRHAVARADSVASVKALIKSDYNSDPANVNALFLLGHIPVPYSGNLAPDGHAEHLGAWPADAYYGDMDGSWSDSVINNSAASDPRNRNVPGDGKFDQSWLPSGLELEVGRVDFANLPAFPQGETELLRRYLEKDHNFRHGFIAVQSRAVVDDHFGAFNGEAFAANGWRGFAPFVGAAGTEAGDWLAAKGEMPWLWGYGCGSGTWTSASGVASTADLVTSDSRSVFALMFGSYFGDWDSQNNLLRAQLASSPAALANAWAGRPFWTIHHMALGETIGFSTRLTQNNTGLYITNYAPAAVHIALMGDPTLRAHPVVPPSCLIVTANGASGALVTWRPSPDTVAGYHVFRGGSLAGPFSKLTTNPITATNYAYSSRTGVFMVRGVKLEERASGSYFNASQGVFQSFSGTNTIPGIVLSEPASNSVFVTPASIKISASLSDPAAAVTNLEFFVNGTLLAADSSPPFTVTWTNPPLGVYALTAKAFSATGLITNTPPVSVTVDNGGRPELHIDPQPGSSNVISGEDVLGRRYRVQALDDPASTNWQVLGTVTFPVPGFFRFTDPAPPARRLYRSAFP